jgi:hypothetical protein
MANKFIDISLCYSSGIGCNVMIYTRDSIKTEYPLNKGVRFEGIIYYICLSDIL